MLYHITNCTTSCCSMLNLTIAIPHNIYHDMALSYNTILNCIALPYYTILHNHTVLYYTTLYHVIPLYHLLLHLYCYILCISVSDLTLRFWWWLFWWRTDDNSGMLMHCKLYEVSRHKDFVKPQTSLWRNGHKVSHATQYQEIPLSQSSICVCVLVYVCLCTICRCGISRYLVKVISL